MVLIFANLGTLNSIWRMRAAMVAGTGGKSRGEIQIGKKSPHARCCTHHGHTGVYGTYVYRACDWKVCLCALAGFWWIIFWGSYRRYQKKMSSRDPE